MRQKKSKQRIQDLSTKVLEVKKIKVVVGKEKKPIDKQDEIIFWIDI